MQEEYDQMMKWALGPDYRQHNIKDSPKIWRLEHPDLLPLETLENNSALLNACYFVFQMNIFWIARTKKNYHVVIEEDIHLDEPEKCVVCIGWANLVNFFRRLWSYV